MAIIIRSLLMVLVLLLIWFVNNSFNGVSNQEKQVTEILGLDGVPDYYSENLKLQQFNEQGVLRSVINTDRLLHYPDQQQAFLESPEIIMYGNEGNIWEVTSVTGSIADNNSNLTLTDDVSLRLHNKVNQQKVVIKTDSLNYNISEQILWTDSDVFAETEQGIFNAKGLKILIKSEHIFLKKKVRIQYGL